MGVAIHAGFALFNLVQERLAARQQRQRGAAVLIEVHLKQGFAAWRARFDGDAANRAAMCDEARTLCAKVSDDLALVALFGVDLAKFRAMIADPAFADLVAPFVAKHVPHALTPYDGGCGGGDGSEGVFIAVHLKQGFAAWKAKFDGDAANRAAMCDEPSTQCGAASEEVAMVALRDVDLRKFSAFVADETFAKLVAPFVSTHVPYLMAPLA